MGYDKVSGTLGMKLHAKSTIAINMIIIFLKVYMLNYSTTRLK